MKPQNIRLGMALGIPALLLLLFEGVKGQKAWMEAWVNGVMAPVEQFLGRIWALFPWCSAAELLTALILVGGVIWLVRGVVLLVRQRAWGAFVRRLLALGAVILWLWAGVCWMWNAAYYAPTFAEKSGLEVQPYSVEQLAQVTAHFAQQAGQLARQVERDETGGFSYKSAQLLVQGVSIYDNLSQEFPFLTMESVAAKPIFCSRLQSRLGFTGIYFPFTGEANVNVDAPACLLPATIAHEMAHQRMVALEDEANFVGIAAAVSCDQVVFQYSGYLLGLIHLSNALYPVAPEKWNQIVQTWFTPELRRDWEDNNAYWAALASPVEEAAGQVYDHFLKENDQALGLRSYGACVDLLVAYFTPPL